MLAARASSQPDDTRTLEVVEHEEGSLRGHTRDLRRPLGARAAAQSDDEALVGRQHPGKPHVHAPHRTSLPIWNTATASAHAMTSWAATAVRVSLGPS